MDFNYFRNYCNLIHKKKMQKIPALLKIILAAIMIIAIHIIVCLMVPGMNYLNWIFFESIILGITAVFIGFQAYYTGKLFELSIMPSAFFVLKSTRALLKEPNKKTLLVEELLKIYSKEQLLKTQFIIKNNSKFPILFNVKITFQANHYEVVHDNYWEDSLHVFPGQYAFYPEVIHLEDIIRKSEGTNLEEKINNIKNKKIIAKIQYTYTPKVEKKYPKTMSECWIFDLEQFRWVGPNGIIDENINLF